jgi:hypothetical protein
VLPSAFQNSGSRAAAVVASRRTARSRVADRVDVEVGEAQHEPASTGTKKNTAISPSAGATNVHAARVLARAGARHRCRAAHARCRWPRALEQPAPLLEDAIDLAVERASAESAARRPAPPPRPAPAADEICSHSGPWASARRARAGSRTRELGSRVERRVAPRLAPRGQVAGQVIELDCCSGRDRNSISAHASALCFELRNTTRLEPPAVDSRSRAVGPGSGAVSQLHLGRQRGSELAELPRPGDVHRERAALELLVDVRDRCALDGGASRVGTDRREVRAPCDTRIRERAARVVVAQHRRARLEPEDDPRRVLVGRQEDRVVALAGRPRHRVHRTRHSSHVPGIES